MPDSSSDPPREAADETPRELLETDSGRKTGWGIAALVAFAAFAVFAVWRVTSDDAGPVSYTPTSSRPVIVEGTNTAREAERKPGRDSSAAAAFFFTMVTGMTLVAARIVVRARHLSRLRRERAPAHPPTTPPPAATNNHP